MIDRDQAAEIRRLFFAEHWKKGTIASHLGVHADVVERVIGPLGPEPKARPDRPRLLDPYVGFIDEVLERYPKLVSTRIYDMIVERGYAGSLRTLTRHVAEVRPAPKSEVFLRTERLPGEQSQIDWGHVGKLRVPGGERALWVFVIVLAFSRAIWAELVFDLTVHSVRRSLARAAAHFGGATRQWLFDIGAVEGLRPGVAGARRAGVARDCGTAWRSSKGAFRSKRGIRRLGARR